MVTRKRWIIIHWFQRNKAATASASVPSQQERANGDETLFQKIREPVDDYMAKHLEEYSKAIEHIPTFARRMDHAKRPKNSH